MKNFLSVFKESTGEWSMRRLLAFFLVVSGIVAGFLAICKGLETKSIAVAFACPIFFGCLLLLFTTWGDLKQIVAAARGKD